MNPEHVRVEAYHGESDNGGVRNPRSPPSHQSDRQEGEGNYLYHGSVPAAESGMYGFSVRVVPDSSASHADARAAADHLVVR